MKKLSPRFRAFTLIELLIVITIIGILAVALIPRLTGGPGRARDAQRKADLQQIATALEFYADDNGGVYPSTGTNGCVSDLSLYPDYLTSAVDDPSTGNGGGSCSDGYGYTAYTDGGSAVVGYILFATLETVTASGDGIYESFTATATSNYADDIGAETACSTSGSCTAPTYVVGL